MDLKYPKWQEPLAAVILEFDVQRLCAKAQTAEEAITKRLKELGLDEDQQQERLALFDGLSIIRRLKRDRLGIADHSARRGCG